MALLTPAVVTRTGVDVAGTAAAGGGDSFANDGSQYFQVFNGGGSPITVTFITQCVVDGLAVADQTVTVNAGITKKVGPFPTGWYNDVNGLVQVTYSGVTSVTAKVFTCPHA